MKESRPKNKKVHRIRFPLYKILANANYSDRKWSSGCLGREVGGGEVITKEHEESLHRMDMFIILIVVIVSWVYIYVKVYLIVDYVCSVYSLYVSYTLVKL